ncbi:MAG: aminodeoxychorismate/anthranilate synthase component II [bacterium]
MKVVIIDNYDSFTYNLYQRVGELTEPPVVLRNDAVTVDELASLAPERLIISPGPGRPEKPEYLGVCGEIIRTFGPTVPLLGVCLGLLDIVHVLGGRVIPAPAPRHGKTSEIGHDGHRLFAGLPNPLTVMRYHSLVVDAGSLPDCLEVTAWTDDGLIMAARHREWPLVGVQFHPESVGTPSGLSLLRNFISGEL